MKIRPGQPEFFGFLERLLGLILLPRLPLGGREMKITVGGGPLCKGVLKIGLRLLRATGRELDQSPRVEQRPLWSCDGNRTIDQSEALFIALFAERQDEREVV